MKFSIIVPVFEQWHFVDKLSACLEAQTICRDSFEVIFVDNGSKDFICPNTMPKNFRVISCKKPGSYSARNYGIRQSKGQWLVFTDADCLPEPDWLEKIDEQSVLNQDNHCMIAGDVKIVTESQSPNIYEIYDLVKGIPQSYYVEQGYAATANLSFHKNLNDLLGGFDERSFSGGDVDFCRRAAALRAKLIFAKSAVVGHRSRRNWTEVITKARRIKGSQFGGGTLALQLFCIGRTLLPPAKVIIRFAKSKEYSLYFRAIASFVQLQIWMVELYEILRLLFRAGAERR
ncbi:glycosyltransferase family 2 protein [Microbulbifer sp. GL-2]|uniref:glycosyltransferase family 2 protein n=1 Tax=Microbulbifer sp. GL-2 TaxID=2591606 RepID=UPI0011621421|nr:glycosyltransferase family A protein [Microbulbifer sp. GL-2]BBM03891.1 hypothetical protein GL2_39650 [Microbulbifer sp. GL-2]